MRPGSRIIGLLLIVMTFTSCDWLMEVYGIRKRRKTTGTEASEELVPEIKRTDLAKVIIKPKTDLLKVERDPFKPLVVKKRKRIQGVTVDEDSILKDVDFLGVVRIGDNYSALLRTSDAKGAFTLGEKIGPYELTDITQEYIVFSKDNQTYKIKRGEEK